MTAPMFDFEAATTMLAEVVAGIADDQLGGRTPTDMTVGEMVGHVLGFSEAFRLGATKGAIGSSQPPAPPQAPLPPDWRERAATQLKALTAAWREPAAWAGETEVGGVTAPAPEMAMFGLDEVIVHGWDLARATGQPYDFAAGDLDVLLEMLKNTPAEGVPGLFGPRVEVAADAPKLDRVIGLTGRDPNWRP